MKNILLSLLLLLCVSTATMAQYDLSTGYVYSRPQQQMGDYIKHAHGLQFQALYRLPNSRLAFGAGIGFNGYGSETSRQTYRFGDGSTTETDVSVDNAFSTFALIGRLDLLPASIVTPYLTGQAGYSLYRTSLYIENPDDPDGCKPLENKALQTDGAFSVSGGGGLRWDLSSIIKKASKQRFFADISALYTQGGKVSYMNVNIPATPATHHHPVPASGDVFSYSTRFINPVNQVVHEHHVGDVYSSYIRMMEFKLGFVYRISK
ncbi:hypothetical protein Q0590_06565 [Rhodocytophaga aerolata]|uniref:Outer membrane beta-barrel protein n=1 Tax=Rhodocytophaga aerolata TaxID=455078 RepID=A0ABT8R1D5_9BACT|nr:hypothetical protein [Rhodocytophaga aerolata]MDO1445906.1 hypothetical protein [Rhodocytophaga aerolata]